MSLYPEEKLLLVAAVVLIGFVFISFRLWWQSVTWYPTEPSEVKLPLAKVKKMQLENRTLRMKMSGFSCVFWVGLMFGGYSFGQGPAVVGVLLFAVLFKRWMELLIMGVLIWVCYSYLPF